MFGTLECLLKKGCKQSSYSVCYKRQIGILVAKANEPTIFISILESIRDMEKLRIQLKLNTALLSTVGASVCVSQAWHLTFLTYIKA